MGELKVVLSAGMEGVRFVNPWLMGSIGLLVKAMY